MWCICTVPAGSLAVTAVVSDSSLLEAGSSGPTLTCIARETIAGLTHIPSAHWNMESGPVDGIVVTETVRNATTAITTLSFSPLLTSHTGLYHCQGGLVSPAADDGNISILTPPTPVTVRCKWSSFHITVHIANRWISISVSFLTVPAPTMTLSSPRGPVYQGTSLSLNCTALLPSAVDTDVNITVHWIPAVFSDRVFVSPHRFILRSPFIFTLTVTPLNMSDAGQYSCNNFAHSSSQYITDSISGSSAQVSVSVIGMSVNQTFTVLHRSLFSPTSPQCVHLIPWISCYWPATLPSVLSQCSGGTGGTAWHEDSVPQLHRDICSRH